MKPAIKFFHLPWREKILFLKAAGFVLLIRLGLWLLPFRVLRNLLSNRKKTIARTETAYRPPIDKIVRMIKAASACVPLATCLTQAFAAQVLLARYGYAARIRIGVIKTEGGRLQAHAWVESEGRIIIGELPDLSRFRVLSSLREEIL